MPGRLCAELPTYATLRHATLSEFPLNRKAPGIELHRLVESVWRSDKIQGRTSYGCGLPPAMAGCDIVVLIRLTFVIKGGLFSEP